jgi:hypothetical protein
MSKKLNKKDVLRFRNEFAAEIVKTLSKAVDTLDSYPDNLDLAQAVYEVFSRNMGALDALMALRLIPQDVRLTTMMEQIAAGKELALKAHRDICSGCDGSEHLQAELRKRMVH